MGLRRGINQKIISFLSAITGVGRGADFVPPKVVPPHVRRARHKGRMAGQMTRYRGRGGPCGEVLLGQATRARLQRGRQYGRQY
jgi:hypothetical protein